jgi:hypothetical protein
MAAESKKLKVDLRVVDTFENKINEAIEIPHFFTGKAHEAKLASLKNIINILLEDLPAPPKLANNNNQPPTLIARINLSLFKNMLSRDAARIKQIYVDEKSFVAIIKAYKEGALTALREHLADKLDISPTAPPPSPASPVYTYASFYHLSSQNLTDDQQTLLNSIQQTSVSKTSVPTGTVVT